MLNNISYRRQNCCIAKSLTVVLVALFAFQFSAMSQSIDNRLGAGGQLIIRFASDTFATVPQNTGLLNLNRGLTLPGVTTGSTIGTIYKGTNRFVHTYEVASTTGKNTFIGINAGNFTMSGSSNQASRNTAVGYSALTMLTSGYGNSAFGCEALDSNSTGTSNSAFGNGALTSNTAGAVNSAFGSACLPTNTEGIHNSAFGVNSLYKNTIGNYNTAIGTQSLFFNTLGEYNSGSGSRSLYNNTEGNYNSALGYYAGQNITTGTNLTCIGYMSLSSSAAASNEITLGNSAITSLRCQVTSITALSDARDKKNIQDLNLGIDFLMKVKPRLFNWDRREWYENKTADGSKMEKTPTAGFIAQELDDVQSAEQTEWLRLVLKNNSDRLEATPGNLLPIIVKAVQEIKMEKDQEIAELKTENNELKRRLAQIEQVQKLLVTKMEKLETTSNQVNEVKMSENK